MRYLNSYQKELGRITSLALVSLFIPLFIFFEYILFSRLLAEHYLALGMGCLEEARFSPKLPLVEKSLLYQKAMKLMDSSIRLNPLNAEAYFEYGEAVGEIAKDPELRNSIDLKSLGAKEDGLKGYYGLVRVKYTEAVSREPTNGIYHQRLGDVFMRLSEEKKGESEFNDALLLDPQNATIHLYLSGFYFSRGDQQVFLYHLNRAIDLGDEALDGSLRSAVFGFLKSIDRLDLLRSKYYKAK